MNEHNVETDNDEHVAIWKGDLPVLKSLFILLLILGPFLGGWVGYTYAPPKFVEVVKVQPAEPLPDAEMKTAVQQYDNDLPLRQHWEAASKNILYIDERSGKVYFEVLPERGEYRPFTTYIYYPDADKVHELGPSPLNPLTDVADDNTAYVSVSEDGKRLFYFDLERNITTMIDAGAGETFWATSRCELSNATLRIEWKQNTVRYGVFQSGDPDRDDWCQVYDLLEIRAL